MTEKNVLQRAAIAQHLSSRRNAILDACRAAAKADPEQTTVDSLTRAQFNDHLPQVLDAFEKKLSSRPGGERSARADEEQKKEEVKHGLHRWQQGYQLRELLHEWGHLHLSLFDELQAFSKRRPDIEPETMVSAHRELVALVNEAISSSTGQYARMQQDEAAGHVRDLQRALTHVGAMERNRAQLIHQVVHDLRGNVQSVNSAADVLTEEDLAHTERTQYATMLQHGTEAVNEMLEDLMTLARLEAGQERRTIASLDSGKLLEELCSAVQPVARERNLYLTTEGPGPLTVQGDAAKVRRIIQNLVLNALKYTTEGGVAVSWGEEGPLSWWVIVKDTGPGLLAGPGAPIVAGLKEATASARESDEKSAAAQGEEPKVVAIAAGDSGAERQPAWQQPGEGIGLSIVKRLCELLDASLELASSAGSGTTFRVVLPKRYPSPL